MSAIPMRRARVLKAFRDAGTGLAFNVNDQPSFDSGSFDNYEAAGLIEACPTKVRAPRKSASKRR